MLSYSVVFIKKGELTIGAYYVWAETTFNTFKVGWMFSWFTWNSKFSRNKWICEANIE